MAFVQKTLKSTTVFAEQKKAGDVVYVKHEGQHNRYEGKITCQENSWEVHYADGTIEVMTNTVFNSKFV